MTDRSSVVHILGVLKSIPDQTDVALMIRHAEREQIPIDSFGVNVPLTADGVASAIQLGRVLGSDRQICVVSSPVPRCVQTAEAVLKGSGCNSTVRLDRRLGDPGPFVVDPVAAAPVFLETDILDVVRHQLSQAEPLPGMGSTVAGVRTLFDFVTDGLKRSGRLNVFVTHDSILAVFVASVLGESIEQVSWPDFLDGLLMWESCTGLNVVWRGVRKVSNPLGS